MKWVKADHLESPIYPLLRFVDGLNKKYGRVMRDIPIIEIRSILDEADLENLDKALEGEMIEPESLPTIKLELNKHEVLDLIECASALKGNLTILNQDKSELYFNVEKLQMRLMREYRALTPYRNDVLSDPHRGDND